MKDETETPLQLTLLPEAVRLIADQWMHLPPDTPRDVVEAWAKISIPANEALRRRMEASQLTEENIVSILLSRTLTKRLIKTMGKEHGTYLPLAWRYHELARSCKATPDELRQIVQSLVALKPRNDELLGELVFHPLMPEEMLMLLFHKGRCLTDLGHRSEPQRLLELMAETYAYSEAITTLALRYYSQDAYSSEQFGNFLKKHATNGMLKSNLLHATNLSPEKRAVVEEVFGGEGAGKSMESERTNTVSREHQSSGRSPGAKEA